MIRISELKLKHICSVFVVMLPFLTMYKSPIPFLDMGSFLIILLILPVLQFSFSRNNGMRIHRDIWALYLIYMLAVTLVSVVAGRHFNSVLGYCVRMIKNIIYIIFTLYLYYTHLFSYKIAVKLYKKVTWIATVYIIIQYVCYRLLYYGLPGYIPSLIYTEGYAARVSSIVNTAMFRPTSLFYEPAHYFEYVCLAIVCCLFYSEKRKDLMLAVFITIGVFISTSGQGIVFSAFIWGIWMLKNMMKISRKNKIRVVAVCLILLAMLVYLLGSVKGMQIMNRLVSSGESGNAVLARAQGFARLEELTLVEILFGCGYGNYPGGFFSSWAFNFWCLGIIGTLIIIVIYLQCFIKSKLKMIVILNLLMSIFSTVFMGFCFVFNFSFILAGITEVCNDEGEEDYSYNRFQLSKSDDEWGDYEESG